MINWDGALAGDLLSAERELKQLAQRAQIAICDSSYNASKLHGLGLTNTTVVPLPIRINKPLSPVKPLDNPTILFVGRIAPNKAFQDMVATAIERVMTDQNLSKSMIAAGKQRASIFSESNTASKFFSAINSMGYYEN